MFIAILSPQKEGKQDDNLWRESFCKWEELLEEFEGAAGVELQPFIKSAPLLSRAPDSLRPQLALDSDKSESDY